MLGQAPSLYRRHFAAFLLTCALALVPSNMLMAGAVAFGLASMGATSPRDLRAPDQRRDLKDEQLSPQDRALRARQIGNDAIETPTAPGDLFRSVLPIVYSAVVIVSLLLAGVFLAHAAMVPLVLALAAGQPCGPARAWALVRLRWVQVLAMLVLMIIFAAAGWGAALLVSRGPWRMFVSSLVRLLTFPLPLAALVLLFEDARAEEAQYIRRSSAPG
jgi:hypothetical protein